MSLTDDLMKASPTSTDLGEIGSSGLVQYGGEVREDFLRQLQGRRGYATFREMSDNHPVIGAVLYSIEMLVRGVEWSVTPADPNDQRAVDEAQFVSSCMTDMSHSWPDTLSSVLSMLTFGYSYNEVVSGHGEVFLPIERCLLFRTTTKRNNPQGRSILRNAFVPWYFQKRIQEIEAIGIERDLAGLPVALVPPHLLSDNATAQETAALTAIKQIVRNVRRDEQEGIVFPLAYDPDTKQLAYDLKLLSTGGRRQFDTSAIISRYDARIAMTTLADFILLGHDKVGTQALSVSKIQLFADALETWVAGIADVINTHAIPRLMRLNGVDSSLFPTLDYSTPRQVDIGAIADYVSKLASAGAIIPDENLGEHLRDIAGLPQEEAESL
jgi:hypothetical protein